MSTCDIFVISEQSKLIAFDSDMLNMVAHLLKRFNLTVSDYSSLDEGEDDEDIHWCLLSKEDRMRHMLSTCVQHNRTEITVGL